MTQVGLDLDELVLVDVGWVFADVEHALPLPICAAHPVGRT